MNELIFRCGFHDVQESDLEGKLLCQFELCLSQSKFSKSEAAPFKVAQSIKSNVPVLSCEHAAIQVARTQTPTALLLEDTCDRTLPGRQGRRRLPVSPVLLLGLLKARYWRSNCVQICPSSLLQWDRALAQAARGFLRCSRRKGQEHLRKTSKKCQENLVMVITRLYKWKSVSTVPFASLFTRLLQNLASPHFFRGFLCLDLLAAVVILPFHCSNVQPWQDLQASWRSVELWRTGAWGSHAANWRKDALALKIMEGKTEVGCKNTSKTLPKTLLKFVACTPQRSCRVHVSCSDQCSAQCWRSQNWWASWTIKEATYSSSMGEVVVHSTKVALHVGYLDSHCHSLLLQIWQLSSNIGSLHIFK